MREEQSILEHNADPAALGRGVERNSVDRHGAPLELDRPGEGEQQGRLSGTVGPDHSEHAPGRHAELHVEGELLSPYAQRCREPGHRAT